MYTHSRVCRALCYATDLAACIRTGLVKRILRRYNVFGVVLSYKSISIAIINAEIDWDLVDNYMLIVIDILHFMYLLTHIILPYFNCPSVAQRNITQINKEVCLYLFKDDKGNVKNSISGRIIRNEVHKNRYPDTLPALREWSRLLRRNNIDCIQTLNNFFNGITNNYLLIQFQYKLLM